MTDRARFFEVLAEITSLEQESRAFAGSLQAEYQQALVTRYAELSGKKVKEWPLALKRLPNEEATRISERYTGRDDTHRKEIDSLIKMCKSELRDLAKVVPLAEGTDRVWVEHSRHWSNNYATQTQRCHYAEVSAKLSAARVESYVPTQISELKILADDRVYTVLVHVADKSDVELLRYKPTPSARDWLKLCLKLGANPRVFNPHLPHGLEERWGLDAFGNDIQQGSV